MEVINRNRTNDILRVDLEISAAGAFDSPTVSIGLLGEGEKKPEHALLPEVAHFS